MTLTSGIARTAMAILLAAALACVSVAAQRDANERELRLLSSDGMKPAIDELLPELQRAVGRSVVTQFDASKRIRERIAAGEPFDVAILLSGDVDTLAKQGIIAPGTRAEAARFATGIGYKSGTPPPDVATTEALKQTLLHARSIALNPNGASADHLKYIMNRLGISEMVQPKLMFDAESGQPQKNVAEGKAELVMSLSPAIRFFPGLALAGPLPGELRRYEVFEAAIATNSHHMDAARAAIQFITSPAAAQVWTAKGAEPR